MAGSTGGAPSIDVSFLVGEVHALVMFAQILAVSSPHARQVLSNLEVADQVGLAKIESEPVGDDAVQGYQFVVGELRRVLISATGT